MERELRILHIEDDSDDAELILAGLRGAGWRVSSAVVDRADQLRRRLAEEWDLVVCDYSLPAFGALEALSIVREAKLDLPFIVVSGCIGEEAAVAMMRAGAADCVNKGNLARLPPAVERELKEAENRRARRVAEHELEWRACYDGLTGLPNRDHLLERFDHRLTGGAADGCAVLVLGFDRIRMVSDTLGQSEGDRLDQGVALRLRGLLPPESLVGCVTDGEFAAVVPAEVAGEGWESWLGRLMKGFEEPFVVRERELFVAPTVGVSLFPEHAGEAEGLLRSARAAMGRARANGESHIFFTHELERENLRRLLILQRLREAVRGGGFEVHYQPKVSLPEGRVRGLEALVRWRDAELGVVSPELFIPIAEESGEILAIGDWVLREVCRRQRRWRDGGLPLVKVAVNLSVRQLRDPGFVDRLREILAEERLPASAIELEVTESGIMSDPSVAAAILSEVRAMGITIAVDDFGTGYSSLSYLKRLPLSTLKVDRSFILDVGEDGDSQAIVEAIVAMAHGLGLNVVAEGVETSAHAAFLERLGCEEAQGYLFSPPLDADRTEAYLAGSMVSGPPTRVASGWGLRGV